MKWKFENYIRSQIQKDRRNGSLSCVFYLPFMKTRLRATLIDRGYDVIYPALFQVGKYGSGEFNNWKHWFKDVSRDNMVIGVARFMKHCIRFQQLYMN